MAVGDRLQIADKPTLDNVNTKIGDTGDTGGSSTEGSLMAKLNEILEQLGISTTGSTVQEVLEELLTSPNNIKNKQYGFINRQNFKSQNNQYYTREIELAGFSNSNKMFAILDGSHTTSNATNVPFLCELTTSTLTIGIEDGDYASAGDYGFSYQVIELS